MPKRNGHEYGHTDDGRMFYVLCTQCAGPSYGRLLRDALAAVDLHEYNAHELPALIWSTYGVLVDAHDDGEGAYLTRRGTELRVTVDELRAEQVVAEANAEMARTVEALTATRAVIGNPASLFTRNRFIPVFVFVGLFAVGLALLSIFTGSMPAW